MTIGDDSTQLGDADFEDRWSGRGSCRVVDDGRFEPIGDRRYRTTTGTGAGAGIVELTIGQRSYRCLRAIDLPAAGGAEEIGQPLIDLESGRTLAYWQYRPTGWGADSASWIASHPGSEIVVDDLVFQRRNCTGRDEIALTVYGIASASWPGSDHMVSKETMYGDERSAKALSSGATACTAPPRRNVLTRVMGPSRSSAEGAERSKTTFITQVDSAMVGGC